MTRNASLVVDGDLARGNELRSLLQFMEEGDVVLASGEDLASHVEDTRGLRAIFIGQCECEAEVGEVVRVVRQADANVPIVLVDHSGQTRKLPDDVAAACCARLTSPFRHNQLSRLLEELREWRERRRASQPKPPVELFRSLVGRSTPIAEVRDLIERVAPCEASVLILGDSGTGKEVVARNIHYYSARRKGPFVPINCGAIPESLLESELFGHEKGAFTGAISARRGRFELAEGGTLFLDEIGDMPLPMQVKLLRVLQEHVFERVGSHKPIRTDVRIVAATHRNLEDLIDSGGFREDLYYRLNVFPIEMPALRDRIEDLPLLVSELLGRLKGRQGVVMSLTPAAMRCLQQYRWPGNVRELANLMERLAILNPGGRADVADLPEKFRMGCAEIIPIGQDRECDDQDVGVGGLPVGGLDLKQYLVDVESRLILNALDESQGVVAHAASLLKMRRTTLVEKMRKYGLKRESN